MNLFDWSSATFGGLLSRMGRNILHAGVGDGRRTAMRVNGPITVALASIGATVMASVALADCDRFIAQAQATAAAITVKVENAERPQAGTPIKIGLRIGERRQLEHPVYFVTTTSPDVRFAGQGFFALTAKAKGPWGMAYGADGARAFVPLHRRAEAAGSEIAVKPYRRGVQTID